MFWLFSGDTVPSLCPAAESGGHEVKNFEGSSTRERKRERELCLPRQPRSMSVTSICIDRGGSVEAEVGILVPLRGRVSSMEKEERNLQHSSEPSSLSHW